MKKLNILEFTIIGFFIAVILSTFLMYITSTGLVLDGVLGYISLVPVLNRLPIPSSNLWLVSFFFYILVYTLYSLVLAIVFRKNNWAKATVPVLIVILCFLLYFEYSNFKKIPIVESIVQVVPVARVSKDSDTKAATQYFGSEGKVETKGDLNGDAKDDIAFIINRKDEDRGMLYYMATSLASTTGYVGTNLVFLGNKVEPTSIKIVDGVINVEQTVTDQSSSTTTQTLYAKLSNDNTLEIISKP